MMRRVYSFLHNISNKRVEMRREALFFTAFFLSAAVIWLIFAALLLARSSSGLYSYHLAARYVPEMVRSALLSVPLAVTGGVVLDLHLRENS